MEVGLGVLRLTPDAFWRATPRELAAALRGLSGDVATAMNRDEFSELMRRFPDGE